MKIYPYVFSILPLIMFAGCSANDDNIDMADEEQVYSFTAVLGEPATRFSYEEDEATKNLKLHWDDGDIIRLYPDASMGDDTEYYEFVAHTSQRTKRCAFIYKGVIPNWEKWSGKAVFAWPGDENLTVEDDSEEFEKRIHTQTSNGNKDHLKYAEHVLGEDGTRKYSEFWKQPIKDINLKDNYELCFNHPHTVIYKIMLRGFIYDIPGGSELRMSGDAWPDGEVITLTLGSKDDNEPFLKVGEFGRTGYDENAELTAYIIRQVAGDIDGKISEGGKLKFELFSYDEDDDRVYPLVAEDKQTHRTSKVAEQGYYFKNLPWGDEYTWEVTATADISYNVGDYVVADLSSLSNTAYYPRIAIDLGLPRKWAAYPVGAHKVDDYGKLFAYGDTIPHNLYHRGETSDFSEDYIVSWTSGDERYDAATASWGEEWITPTEKEMFDLIYYCRMVDSSDNLMPLAVGDNVVTQEQWKDPTKSYTSSSYVWQGTADCYKESNDVLLARLKSTLNGRYFYCPLSGSIRNTDFGNEPGIIAFMITNSMFSNNYYSNFGPFIFFIKKDTNILGYNPVAESNKKAYSVRPVKRHLTN